MKLVILLFLQIIFIAVARNERYLFGPGVRESGSYDRSSFCSFRTDGLFEYGLEGIKLSVVVRRDQYFEHDEMEEVSATNPRGIIAELCLDELALRANFTWRNSFVSFDERTVDILSASDKSSKKWDNMLKWTTENFDLSAVDWLVTADRTVEGSFFFLHSWYDSDLILVDEGNEQPLEIFKWTKPFDTAVWILVLGTIVISAFVHQLIEGCYHERGNRSIQTWVADNIYLSFISFCSHFNHETPRSSAGRIFLFSFAFWSFLVGAAYTANLASLLVEDAFTSEVDNLDEAMEQGLRICVEDGTAIESIVEERTKGRFEAYGKVVECSSRLEMYKSLENETCDLLVGTRQDYEVMKNQERFGCGLVEAGETIFSTHGSFATKFDPIRKCSTLLGYILDAHLTTIDLDGDLSDLWETFIENSKEDQCEEHEQDSDANKNNRELLTIEEPTSRELRAANSASEEANEEELKLGDMTGIFVVHGFFTFIALCFAGGDYLLKGGDSGNKGKSKLKKDKVPTVKARQVGPSSIYLTESGGAGSKSRKPKVKGSKVDKAKKAAADELSELKGKLVELKHDYDTKNSEYFTIQLMLFLTLILKYGMFRHV